MKATVMLRIISYNIRYNNPDDGENAWPHRKARVVELLNRYQPDLIGLQEVRKEPLDDLIAGLPDFGWAGVGRDDGKEAGEFAAIFYRQSRLHLAQSATFWLSETPHVVGSVGWDASLPRVATWAEFADAQNGARFLFVNTHFDHRGMTAQVESAHLLRRFLAERTPALPAIVTGDFNCVEASSPYAALTTAADGTTPLRDAMYASQAAHEGPTGTFNNDFADPLHDKIDYIFVWQPQTAAAPAVQVQRHATLADQQNGRYPSDHLPLLAEVVM
ncbi:MAG: endonuclease/exonuclease/phosphatase family protein [Caldilineaceae bacterium]|nr:endonuclease/exonuclease/phosphatase family protein [Caldilineaceae bacterium]